MKVLFLTHRLPYAPNRGDRIRAYHLARVLAQSAQVHIVSLVHSVEEQERADEVRSIGVDVDIAAVPRAANLVRAAFSLPGQVPLTHVLLHSGATDRILHRLTAVNRPDVVLAYCSGMARYALAPPLTGIPWVLDMVDVDSAKWAALAARAHGFWRWIYAREADRLRRFEAVATSSAFVTTVVNAREQLALASINPAARIHVVSVGIDLPKFQPTDAPQPSANVVFCGVFNYEPNEYGALWLAQEVWPLVRQRRADATLTLVGMDPTRRVRDLAADPSITVTGPVPDVRPYLWNAAAATAPLFVAHGLQNKVLEALAAGLPCIVTPQVLEGIPDAARPACTSAATAEAFADAILAAMALTPRERRDRAGLAKLDGLSWETQLAPMLGLLSAAAGSPARQGVRHESAAIKR